MSFTLLLLCLNVHSLIRAGKALFLCDQPQQYFSIKWGFFSKACFAETYAGQNVTTSADISFANSTTHYPQIHYEILKELQHPIVQKYVPIPEDHFEQLALARTLQIANGVWENRTGAGGDWAAFPVFNIRDIKKYYFENYTKNFEEVDMKVCVPYILHGVPTFFDCNVYNPDVFEEIDNTNAGSWNWVYERNKGRIEADFAVFAFIMLFGVAGKFL